MFPPFKFWELGSFEMLMLQKSETHHCLCVRKFIRRGKNSPGGGKSLQRQGKETREGSAVVFFGCAECFHAE